jgi:hypothetical protein
MQMKTLAIMVAAVATAWAGEKGAEPGKTVTVCVDPSGDGVNIRSAQTMASKHFAKIGIIIDWHELRDCMDDRNSLQITLSYDTPPNQLPGSLAYALPYEGRHIVVFYDRLQQSDPNLVTRLLAYTLAHEITHILEGITRHSGRGIMKAHWDREDRFEIGLGRLGFAPEDIDLIYRGVDARALAIAAPPIPGPVAAR